MSVIQEQQDRIRVLLRDNRELRHENMQLKKFHDPFTEDLIKTEEALLDLRRRIKEYVNHPESQMSFKTLQAYAQDGLRLTVKHRDLELKSKMVVEG